jgi:hypothetical protein
MDVKQAVKNRLAGPVNGCVGPDAGIVDQEIKFVSCPCGLQGIGHLVHKAVKGLEVPDIQLKGDGLLALCLNLGDHRIGRLLLTVIGYDRIGAVAGIFRLLNNQFPAL